MEASIGLLRVFMKHGVIDECILSPLFDHFFKSFPELTKEQQMEIFIDITGMKSPCDYPNTWMDMEFTMDENDSPCHPSFK